MDSHTPPWGGQVAKTLSLGYLILLTVSVVAAVPERAWYHQGLPKDLRARSDSSMVRINDEKQKLPHVYGGKVFTYMAPEADPR